MNRPDVRLAVPAGESAEHYALKLIAVAWMWRRGYRAIGTEIEVGAFRVDAAAGRQDTMGARACVVEAKATRSDFLRDLRLDERVVGAHGRLAALRREINAQVLGPAERRSLERRMEEQQALLRGTYQDGRWEPVRSKLTCPTLRELTTERYVIAPAGVVLDDELPRDWGILRADGSVLRRSLSPGTRAAVGARTVRNQLAARMTYALVDALPGGQGRGGVVRPPPMQELAEMLRRT